MAAPMQHPAAEALRITPTRRPPGLAISGEIDETTYPDLVAALTRFADGLAEIHVGLAGVEYCDLAGLRTILRLARGNGQRRCVVLHDVPPHLREVLRILGWDATPRLTIAEADGRAFTRGNGVRGVPGQIGVGSMRAGR